MIKIKKTEIQKGKTEPYYLLTYDYMIGDANGNTTEEVQLSKDNPFIERYCTLLNSLKPTKGTWGLILDRKTINKCLQEKQLKKDDFEFLYRLMFGIDEDEENKFEVTPENEDYSYEFFEGVISDTEYSFLVFEGVSLEYIDEYGVTHNTEFK